MQLYSSYWVVLPQEVRNKFKAYFAIQRSAGSHVENGRVVSDGHTDNDLKAITVEKMQKLLKSDEKDENKLIEATITFFTEEVKTDKVTAIKQEEQKEAEVKQEEVKAVDEVVQEVAKVIAKRRGKKSK